MKQAWLPHRFYIPHLPYLSDTVIFPLASQISNGHLLPARIRSYISDEPEGTPFKRDVFSTQRLKSFQSWTPDPSQIPNDDILLSRCSWFNQTIVIYFELEFEERGLDDIVVPYIGRGLFAAWNKVDREREEQPNL
jgi:hypothetical protein